MLLRISKKSPLFWLYVVGVVLLFIAGWLWCSVISVNPERVFWGTIQHGLTSRGVTVAAEQSANGTSIKQTIRYSLGANNLSHSISILSQQGTTIKNEMIGTPTIDYTRYVDIKTDQKKADGSAINFTKLLGVWAKSEEGRNQFFPQAVFGSSLPIGGLGVPMGNVSPDARNRLLSQIKDTNAYKIDFRKVKKERSHGRLLYTYSADVRPAAYVAVMKQFAKDVGLHGLDQVDPQMYKDQPSFKLSIAVDARARNIIRITAVENKSTQTYSGHDVPVQVAVPEHPITGQRLRQLLSELQ